MLGKFYSERGIEHGVMRDKHGVVDGVLIVSLAVGDDRGESRFASGTRGGGHGKERRYLFKHLENAFHFAHGLVGTCDARADTLGAIHGRAAAESDYAFAVALFIQSDTRFDIVNRGIGHNVFEKRVLKPYLIHFFEHAVEHPERIQSVIRHDEHRVDTFRLYEFWKFPDAAFAR